jgi:hypothetical protein
MKNYPLAKYFVGALLFVGLLGVARYRPWIKWGGEPVRGQLKVGFLPVT